MRKVVAVEMVSLDGVMEKPEEWAGLYSNDEMNEANASGMAAADALLLGRVTYEQMAGFWPNQSGGTPMVDYINNVPKYVVSTTLEEPLEWNNSTLIKGNVAEEIAALKRKTGKDITILGSATLVRSLLKDGLLDELRLMVHPIVLGSGQRLFEDGEDQASLELLDSQTFSTGVIYITYQPAVRQGAERDHGSMQDNTERKESSMKTVASSDGTTIAFDRLGDGPSVILVCGQSTDRSSNAPLAALLAEHFTVYNYDRRGRGDSGDTAPYAVEREVEDIEVLIDEAGGLASVLGVSSGAALALEAAASDLAISKLALWEPPFDEDEGRRPPRDLAERYERMIAEGRRGDVIEYFMANVVGLPPEFVAHAKAQPFWQHQEALAHTLVYDTIVMGDHSLPVDRAAAVAAPTLALAGGESFPFMRETARKLADVMPDARASILEGQTHNVDPATLAPVLKEFFSG